MPRPRSSPARLENPHPLAILGGTPSSFSSLNPQPSQRIVMLAMRQAGMTFFNKVSVIFRPVLLGGRPRKGESQ